MVSIGVASVNCLENAGLGDAWTGGSPICWFPAMWISPSSARCPMKMFLGSVFLMYNVMALFCMYATTFWPTSPGSSDCDGGS